MRKNIFLQIFSLLALLLVFVSSCTQMDDYKDFIKDGEISYTGKIDSVVIYSGDERLLIEGLFISDPKIVRCRIFWNNKLDSVEISVNRTDGIDTLRRIISLPENLYNFEIYTYDALGNKSIPVYTIGRAYGTNYKASLNNRLINSAIVDENNVKIEWRNIDKTLGAFVNEVKYTDNSGTERTVRVGIDDAQTILENYKVGTSFSSKTLYRPDSLCIDTFYSVAEMYTPLLKIDKTGWIATADTYEATGKLPLGGLPQFAIDDNVETYWHTKQAFGGTAFPHWLAVDMGESHKLEIVELTALASGVDADFRDFKIQGRNAESEAWIDYGTFTLEDVSDPQMFTISGTPAIRYLRIYQLNGKSQHSFLAELSVYKY